AVDSQEGHAARDLSRQRRFGRPARRGPDEGGPARRSFKEGGWRMNVRRVAKWTVGVLLVIAVAAFLAFLYLIPPFTLMAPEEFSGPEAAAANVVKLDAITDSKTRALAERGKYLVVTTGC